MRSFFWLPLFFLSLSLCAEIIDKNADDIQILSARLSLKIATNLSLPGQKTNTLVVDLTRCSLINRELGILDCSNELERSAGATHFDLPTLIYPFTLKGHLLPNGTIISDDFPCQLIEVSVVILKVAVESPYFVGIGFAGKMAQSFISKEILHPIKEVKLKNENKSALLYRFIGATNCSSEKNFSYEFKPYALFQSSNMPPMYYRVWENVRENHILSEEVAFWDISGDILSY